MENTQCTKVKFSSEKYADFHINKHKLENEKKGLKARSYKCKICPNSWHITSKIENYKLIADNEFLLAKVEELKKTNQKLADSNSKFFNQERKELRQEAVVEALENIVSKNKEAISGMSKKIKDLVSFNDALLKKISSLEEENNRALNANKTN